MNIFPAHIRETDGAMQTVSEHCRETAAYAKKRCKISVWEILLILLACFMIWEK